MELLSRNGFNPNYIDRIYKILGIFLFRFPATGQQGLRPEWMKPERVFPLAEGDWVYLLSSGKRI
jgi:hypothetical protein